MMLKEFLGIYADSRKLWYCSCAKSALGPAPKRPEPNMEPAGILHGQGLSVVSEFLERLTPRKKRQIYLALPRDRFSVRDVELPPMAMEDALESVKNSLSLYCHLPPDKVFYDILFHPLADGRINALIIYAPKEEMEPVFKIFSNTGHQGSLKGVFPLFYGMGAWLRQSRYPMPMGLVLDQDSVSELAVFSNKSCVSSSTWLPSDTQGEKIAAARAVLRFEELKGRIFQFGSQTFPDPPKQVFPRLASPVQNPGAAAIMPALSGFQAISIDESPTRIKIFKPMKIIIPVLVLMVAAWAGSSWRMYQTVKGLRKQGDALSLQIKELENRVAPMEQSRQELRLKTQFINDIEEFIKSRPKLFTHLNQLAQVLPEDTWFSQMVFRKNVLTLRGESPDALKVVEALRAMDRFEEVRIKGSVSRRGDMELFTISITLREAPDAGQN